MKPKLHCGTGGHRWNMGLACCGLLLMMCLAGCKHKAGDAATDPAGTYALVSVDGKKVPCVVPHERTSITIHAGTFVIGPDGTCSSKMDFSVPTGKPVTREVEATYRREGAKLVMQWKGAGMTTGTFKGDTFEMNNEGMLLTYQR